MAWHEMRLQFPLHEMCLQFPLHEVHFMRVVSAFHVCHEVRKRAFHVREIVNVFYACVSLIIPSNHVKPKHDLKQKKILGTKY